MKLKNASLLLEASQDNEELYGRVLKQLQIELMIYSVVIGTAPETVSAELACAICNDRLRSKKLQVNVDQFWDLQDLNSTTIMTLSRDDLAKTVQFKRQAPSGGFQDVILTLEDYQLAVKVQLNERAEWLGIESVQLLTDSKS